MVQAELGTAVLHGRLDGYEALQPAGPARDPRSYVVPDAGLGVGVHRGVRLLVEVGAALHAPSLPLDVVAQSANPPS